MTPSELQGHRITWLASYPKSGNTWMRVFLTNLRRGGTTPADINDLDPTIGASGREVFDRLLGYDTANLTHDEIDALRPDVYTHLAAHADTPLICKVHDAYTHLPDGRPLFPTTAASVVIYLVRNPLDVSVSLAHHNQMAGIDPAIDLMRDPQATLGARTRTGAFRQQLLSWSGHVRSWVDAPELAVHVVRYEDLLSRPVETFSAAATFVGLAVTPDAVARALAEGAP